MALCVTHNIVFDPQWEWCPYCGKPERSKSVESPADSPASPVQHAQPAIAELVKLFFDSQYLSVDGRMAVEAFSEYVQQQQAGAQ